MTTADHMLQSPRANPSLQTESPSAILLAIFNPVPAPARPTLACNIFIGRI
jgi:hypothetical protein